MGHPGRIPSEVVAQVGRQRLASLRPVVVGGCVLGYRERPKRKHRPPYNRAGHIVADVERVIALRYGGPCDTDDGSAYLILAANAIVHRARHRGDDMETARLEIAGWAARWVPLVDPEELEEIAERAVESPRKFTADAAARLIRLTAAERAAANVRSIGAIDMPKRQRTLRRKKLKRESERQRRARLRSPDQWQQLKTRPCEFCGEVFIPARASARFCSPRCRKRASRRRKREGRGTCHG